jgi:hypothetical protein
MNEVKKGFKDRRFILSALASSLKEQLISPGSLYSCNFGKTARMADRNRVRRPRSRKIHTRPDFDNQVPSPKFLVPGQKTILRKVLGLEGLGEEPSKNAEFPIGKRSRGLDIKTIFCVDPRDFGRDLLLCD